MRRELLSPATVGRQSGDSTRGVSRAGASDSYRGAGRRNTGSRPVRGGRRRPPDRRRRPAAAGAARGAGVRRWSAGERADAGRPAVERPGAAGCGPYGADVRLPPAAGPARRRRSGRADRHPATGIRAAAGVRRRRCRPLRAARGRRTTGVAGGQARTRGGAARRRARTLAWRRVRRVRGRPRTGRGGLPARATAPDRDGGPGRGGPRGGARRRADRRAGDADRPAPGARAAMGAADDSALPGRRAYGGGI